MFNNKNGKTNGSGTTNGNPPKTKKKIHPAIKFAIIVFGMVFAFIIVGGYALASYIGDSTYEQAKLPNNVYVNTTQKKPGTIQAVKNLFEQVPERTNFMIAGVDDEGGGIRSDTIIMGSFSRSTKQISLVSVPRDLMVSIPEDDVKEYNSEGIYPPSYMKLNEILAYIGPEYGIGALKRQLEHEFGVKLDYYVKVDTQGFRDIIDAIGGVEMTLARDYYYYDPTQNLLIDLKAGPQRLNGKDAEGLVRFRADYGAGDIKRIEVQQGFLGELFRQTLQRENLMQHAPELLRVVLDNVTTDMTLTQATKYLQFLPALSAENLEMYSLASLELYNYTPYQGPDGLSYIRLDRDYVDEIIDEAFYGKGGETPPEDSKELKIAVLNGSGASGVAKETKEMLEEKGYTVSEIGDYTGRQEQNDRIFVKKSGYGQDLRALLEGSEILVDKSGVIAGSDITIVMGTNNNKEE